MADSHTILDMPHMNNSGMTSERSNAMATEATLTGKWPILDKVLDPKGKLLPRWNMIFVISCVLAVFLDPLFLYIPVINDDMKCMGLDKNLKIAALVLRSITDLVYIVKIIFQIYKLKNVTPKEIWESCILVDILAVLPLPQVAIVIFFTKMRGSQSLNTKKFMNFLVLFQYVPRVLRISLAIKEFKNSRKNKIGEFITNGKAELWLSGGLNFFMYIFASHVFGAFWYFFSVQRMIACWQYACQSDNGCKPSTFECHDHPTNRNITSLNAACPISPANTEVFDFGIFLNALQSRIAGSADYSQKLSNCFWWGLRNLSSFGSNLQSSINTWENLFAVSISMIGLLLFLYLIGNLQLYMQSGTASLVAKNMKKERKSKIERKKGKEVESWLAKNGLPMKLKSKIMEEVVEKDVEETEDVDVDNILSILSLELQSHIKNYMRNMEERGRKIDEWLSNNSLPLNLNSEIMKKILQAEVEENRDVDLANILSSLPTLHLYMESVQRKLEEAGLDIDSWLSENEIHLQKKSEIMESVRQELERNMGVDVEKIFLVLLPSYIESSMRRMKVVRKIEQTGIDSWFSRNFIPIHIKTEIMKQIVQRLELEENTEVDVENIPSLLHPELRHYISSFTQKMEEKGHEVDLWLSKNGIPMHVRSEIKEKVQQELQEERDVDVENMLSIFPPKLQRYITSCVQKMEDKAREVHLWSCKNAIPVYKRSEIMEQVRQELEEDRDVDLENDLSIFPPELERYMRSHIQKMEEKDQQVHLWLCKNHIPMRTKSEIMYMVRQELQEERDVDVENILSVLTSELQTQIKNFLQKIEEKDTELDLWLSKNGIPMHVRSEIKEQVQQELQEERDVDVENMLSIFPPKLQRYITSSVQKIEDKERAVHLWSCKNAIPVYKRSEIMEKVRQELEEDRDVDLENDLSIFSPELERYIRSNIQKMKEKDQQVHLWLCKNHIPLRTKSKIMDMVRQELQEERDVDVENILSVLPSELQTHIKNFLQKIEEKVTEVDFWLSANGIPMHNRSEILEKVGQELQLEKDVDVENMLSIFPSKLRIYIKSCMQRMEDKGEEVHLWLFKNGYPMNKKSDIMEKVRQELQEDRDVDVNNILCILPRKLQISFQRFVEKMEEKSQEVDSWLLKNRIPKRKKSDIMEKVRQELEGDRDVDVENILHILPYELQTDIKSFMRKIKEKDQEVDCWLLKNGIPRHNKSEIMKKIQQELEFDRAIDVEDMFSIFTPKLQIYIKGCIKKMEDKGKEVHGWLSKNRFPMDKKSEIMKKVREELQEERDIDVKNILNILPPALQSYIKSFVHKVEEKDREVTLWISKNGIPMRKKSKIMEKVQQELEEQREADVENIISIVPFELQSYIKSCMPLSRLKTVPLLQRMDDEVLEAICECLVPKSYIDMDTIIRENDSLKVMILIVDGTVIIQKGKLKFQRSAGEFCGERLLLWPSSTRFPSNRIPLAAESARTSGNVEALVLMANDLKSIGFKFRSQWNLSHPDPFTMLKNVPMLQRMDEEVVKEIAQHLKSVIYKGCNIIEKNSPLESVFFIKKGTVLFSNGYEEDVELYAEEFYGEELLDWVLDASFPAITPLSTHSASAGNAEILVLTADHLKRVASKFRPHFSTLLTDSRSDLSTFVRLTRLKNVPKLKTMDEKVLKAFSENLEPKRFVDKQFFLYGNEPLKMMFFVVKGVVALQNQYDEIKERRNPGQFYGEELIDWASSTSSPDIPTSRFFARCLGPCEVLVLMANNLESVVSKYRSYFSS